MAETTYIRITSEDGDDIAEYEIVDWNDSMVVRLNRLGEEHGFTWEDFTPTKCKFEEFEEFFSM